MSTKQVFDLGNLLCTWERSLEILNQSVTRILTHFENGSPDSAWIRSKETLKAIEAMQKGLEQTKTHLCGSYHNNVERRL